MLPTFCLAAAAALLALPQSASADGMYSKTSPVLQVDAKSYDSLIAMSNHTSIVEFYAPWCGHCKTLKPAYEKAAKSLSGLAKVAAINCDDESNKPFCGSMGVKGFPTLKIVRPGKKPGHPNVQDYLGQRNAKGIVDAVKEKMPNHVKRVTDKSLDEWLQEGNDTAKAVLFSDKATTSALLKALAVDFLGTVGVAQIRDKEKAAGGMFGITSYPTFVVLPGGSQEATVYDGEMTKSDMKTFLSLVAAPNPDPAPTRAKTKSKTKSSTDKKKASKDSSSFAKASASQAASDSADAKATQTKETLENEITESPSPNIVDDDAEMPIKLPDVAPMIPSLDTPAALQQACLTSKSGICILALLPSGDIAAGILTPDSKTSAGLASLSEIQHKHVSRGGKLFPFYAVPSTNDVANDLRSSLSLAADTEMEVIAVNAKKAWSKRYLASPSSNFGRDALETWIDAIRMGEGAKDGLPGQMIVEPDPAAQAARSSPAAKASIRTVGLDDDDINVQFEELTDEDVERIMAQAKQHAEKADERDRDEL